jgi:rare lipoprotein A
MCSISCARTSNVHIKASRVNGGAPIVLAVRAGNVIRFMAAALGAASLAACAQSSAVSERTELRTADRPLATNSTRHVASPGVASFYTAGTVTASGEKFNTDGLTAAHPTLPFGTRLRVTNVATGQSVTVRVNDRGPFIRGRIVDVSYSAAATLGMVGEGVAKVKLDVVQ